MRRGRSSRRSARTSCARRSRSGAARRSPTSSSSRSPSRRSAGSTSSAWGRSRSGIDADLEVAVDSRAGRPSSRRSCAGTHCASGCAAQLMLALYRAGRQAEALDAYHDARRTLVDELGIEPATELQALYGSILRQERSLARDGAAGARGPLRRGLARAVWPAGSSRCWGRLQAGSPVTSWRRTSRSASSSTPVSRGLAYVAQTSRSRNGIGPLYDELHLALDRDTSRRRCTPGSPRSPPCSGARGAPAAADRRRRASTPGARARVRVRPARSSTSSSYLAAGRNRGKFLHARARRQRDRRRGAERVRRPRARPPHASCSRSTAGRDRGGTRERESFVVSEDDHIDYLARPRSAGRGAGPARRAPPPQPPALPRLRRRRLEPARVPPARVGRRAPRATAPGRCGRPPSTSRASCGASAGSRSSTSRSTRMRRALAADAGSR